MYFENTKNNITCKSFGYLIKGVIMGKMGWLPHLVQIPHHNEEEREELEEFLGNDCNFKNPQLAAEQFLKAYADLERDAVKAKIIPKESINDTSTSRNSR